MKELTRKRGGVDDAVTASQVAELPLEGTLFMLLMGACCLLAMGEYLMARNLLTVAESRFNSLVLGVEHPYYYLIFFCQVRGRGFEANGLLPIKTW